ncbi:DMT family transporter [Solicola sp. PLA-1-18]|uniref:DMT family transporter n=1 Tax=Solicola sp. PLA-1-18 TaxID=3380532 RepID=UPI003B8220F5
MTSLLGAVRRPLGRDGTLLVALAACLWGTSSLMRGPLAAAYPASTIVFLEHLVIVLLLSPWVLPAVRAFGRVSTRAKVSAVVVGGGSSALATTLFTASFAYGDPITPQVLQKLQPLVAILLAAVVLGERLRPRFALFAVPALVGAWVMTFPDPLDVSATNLQAAGLAVGAAALWAAGTVLGRLMGTELGARDVTVLRFVFGLLVAAVIAVTRGVPLTIDRSDLDLLVLLALLPGVLGLTLYYRGLRTTPASRATLAELMFPVTAAVVGVGFLGGTLVASQWLGLVVVVASVTGLALHEQRARRTTVTPGVAAPEAPAPV